MNSDTPRTDALVNEANEAGTVWPNSAIKFRDLAKVLEREISACHEQFSRIYKTLPSRTGGYSGEECVNEFFALKTSSAARIEKLEGALRAANKVFDDMDAVVWNGDSDWNQGNYEEAANLVAAALNPEETKGGGQ